MFYLHYFKGVVNGIMFREVEQLIQGHTAYKCLCDSKDHDLSIEMRSRVYELVNSKKKKNHQK